VQGTVSLAAPGVVSAIKVIHGVVERDVLQAGAEEEIMIGQRPRERAEEKP
jgi:hypothetical protein